MKTNIFRYLYTGLFYLLLPLVILRMLWRSLKAPDYAKRLQERFGKITTENQLPKHGIWLHAVSVGEFNAACALIKKLQSDYPNLPIVITTTTPTGSARVKAVFGDSIAHIYAPYDLPHAVSRFLNLIEPKIAVIMETELWPNILAHCRMRNIPVVIANARLSARSATSYKRVFPIVRSMLGNISMVAAQTDKDANRFIELGMAREQVKITGNLKFDQEIPQSISEIATELRAKWNTTRPVWIAASTHEGEEELVFQAYENILKEIPDCVLLLVPRHPERFAKVTALSRKLGYQTSSRSKDDACLQTQVFIGDTMGELTMFYAVADIAYVGGSLVPIGGHNLLEPAAIGVPSITGPHYFNMKSVTDMLIESGVTKRVQDPTELANTVVQLLQDSLSRSEMGERGRQIILENRGAVDNHLQVISGYLV